MNFSTIHRALRSSRGTFLAVLGLGLLIAPFAASAQTAARDPGFSVEGGVGFTADPDSFLLDFEGAYDFGNGFAVGPALQLGLDDHFVLVSPTIFGRYGFDLSGVSQPQLQRLTPYVQSGMGFTYI